MNGTNGNTASPVSYVRHLDLSWEHSCYLIEMTRNNNYLLLVTGVLIFVGAAIVKWGERSLFLMANDLICAGSVITVTEWGDT